MSDTGNPLADLTKPDLEGSMLGEAVAGLEGPIFVAPAIGVNFVDMWKLPDALL